MEAVSLDAIDRSLLDDFQRDFPLVPRPYAIMAARLGVTESQVLARLERLRASGHIARVGATLRPNTVGASTLAAMAVPPDRLDAVGNAVSRHATVNHNYARDNRLNLWFVVAAADQDGVDATLEAIRSETGLTVHDFPMLTGYHLDLGFPLWTD